MRKIFMVMAVVLVSATMLLSCKKNEGDMDNGITAEQAEMPCSHHSIIHVEAQAPTADENGWIEHYRCEQCGATFSDAAGQNPIEDVILWATDFADPIESPAAGNAEVYYDDGALAKYCDGTYLENLLTTTKEGFMMSLSNAYELKDVISDSHSYRQQIMAEAAKLKNTAYYQTLLQLREEQDSLAYATDSIFIYVMDNFKDKIVNSQMSSNDVSNLLNILNDWNTSENDKVATLFGKIQQRYVTPLATDGMTSYPSYYDYVVRKSPDVLWEIRGYQLRENSRACDAMLMCECYVLTALQHYCTSVSDSQFETEMSELNPKMAAFAKVLKDNSIEYHRDLMICYIPGVNKTFKRALNTVTAWETIYKNKDEYVWAMSGRGVYILSVMKEMNNYEAYQEQSVYKTIYDYYRQRYGVTSIYDILRDAGFTNVGDRLVANHEDGEDVIIGSEEFSSVHYIHIFRWQVGFAKNQDWIGIRTCLQNNCNLCHTNIIVNANIRKNGATISNMGDRCNFTFCSLVEVK